MISNLRFRRFTQITRPLTADLTARTRRTRRRTTADYADRRRCRSYYGRRDHCLIALLLVNGWVRMRAERDLEAGGTSDWKRFRVTSVVSLVLWFTVLLAGVFLTTIS